MAVDATWVDVQRLRFGAAAAARAAESGPGTRLVTTSRGRVRVRDSGGSGPIVVLACDPPNVVEHYDDLFELLAPTYRLVCLELPGFGFSRPVPGFRFGIEEYADTVEHVLGELDVSSCTLAFPCVWSYLALRITARRADLVHAVVLIQAPQWSEEADWARRIDSSGIIRTPFLGQALLAAGSRHLAGRWYRAALPRGHSRAAEAAFSIPAERALRRGAVFCLASLTQAWFGPSGPDLTPVHLPAVVLWGGADRTHRLSSAQSALRYVPAGRVSIDPDAGHFPELEHPDLLRAALSQIMSR
jgi:pimeloyl-ACP methyl ester carboxylesterase